MSGSSGEGTRVLVCGSRYWTDKLLIETELLTYQTPITVIHGGCRGADSIAGSIAHELGFQVLTVPAKWEKYGFAAGPIRNREMLLLSPDIVIAFHEDLESSKGTKHMVSLAQAAGIKVQLVDGVV